MPPTTTTTITPPTVPDGPLSHFLAHPDVDWSHIAHRLVRIAHSALPLAARSAVGPALLVTLVAVVLVVARLRSTSNGQVVDVEVPPTVDPKAAAAFWRNLHPVLAARHRLLARPQPVGFEVTSSPDGIGLLFWVPPAVSTHAVARPVLFWLAQPGRELGLRQALRDTAVPAATAVSATDNPADATWLRIGEEFPRRRVAQLGALAARTTR